MGYSYVFGLLLLALGMVAGAVAARWRLSRQLVRRNSELERLERLAERRAEAMSLSDRIVVMNKGRVEQMAPPGEIYQRPASVFVADFIGRANFLEAAPQGRAADGRLTVNVLGQQLDVPAHPGVTAADGAGAYLMVRPETVGLAPVTDGGTGTGTVLRSTFHGPTVDYEIETRIGTVTIVEFGRDPSQRLPEGISVNILLDAQRSYLLPSE